MSMEGFQWHAWSMARGKRTTSCGETGAFKAAAISWAFSLTLPRLSLIVFRASLKLFCLPRRTLFNRATLGRESLLILRGCHRS